MIKYAYSSFANDYRGGTTKNAFINTQGSRLEHIRETFHHI
jgi:hypothetical protein